MVQGSMSCVKYTMFAFNFLFVICGIILIIVGAIAQTKDVTAFLGSSYVTGPSILIAIGVIIFVIAFLGCCGAAKENRCMVITFGVLLLLILIIEIAGAIVAYHYQGDVEKFLKQNMNDTLTQQKEDGKKIFNEMQTKWKCCGVEGPQDYEKLHLEIPKSCCKPEEDTCNRPNAFPNGCFQNMVDLVNSKIKLVGGVALGIGVIELLGCIAAWCLASAIKKEYEGV